MFFSYCFCQVAAFSQTGSIRGNITGEGKAIGSASVQLMELKMFTTAQADGSYEIKNIPYGAYTLQISAVGFESYKTSVNIQTDTTVIISVSLKPMESLLNEVVVTGTMKEVSRLESPVPVEVFTPQHFKKNPTPSLFDAIGMVNGVQPQLNCNVCNTGDIHINGMEGPYTMILIDGMPIVSSLSTVYGLSGIPNSMVERIEVVKGPASSLYGSEAMGGIINVITKDPSKAPVLSLDVFGTSWQELSADAAMKFKMGKTQSLAWIKLF